MTGECVLYCRDLIFSVKITGTARELGTPIRVAGDVDAAIEMIGDETVHLIVDLSASATVEELSRLRQAAGSSTHATAFGSHVDVQRLKEARDAGFENVLPRSEFVARLVELLQGQEAE